MTIISLNPSSPIPDINGGVSQDNTTFVDLVNPPQELVDLVGSGNINVELSSPSNQTATQSASDVLTPLFPSQVELTGLNNLPDVDATGLEDKSLLMYDQPNQVWKPTRQLEHHYINGGQY